MGSSMLGVRARLACCARSRWPSCSPLARCLPRRLPPLLPAVLDAGVAASLPVSAMVTSSAGPDAAAPLPAACVVSLLVVPRAPLGVVGAA